MTKAQQEKLEELVENGCQSGTCNNLFSTADTHDFYNKFTKECEEIFHEYEREMGEAFKFEGRDMRNTLAWMAYEERARNLLDILEEVEEENKRSALQDFIDKADMPQ
jgi:hypothetical protein